MGVISRGMISVFFFFDSLLWMKW